MNLVRIRRGSAAVAASLLAVGVVLLGATSAEADDCGCATPAPSAVVTDPAPVADTGTPPVSEPTVAPGRPWVSGRTRVGHRLHAHVGALSSGTTLSYQWYRRIGHGRTVAVRHATHRSYRVRAGDVGDRLVVEVTFHGATTAPTALWSHARRVR